MHLFWDSVHLIGNRSSFILPKLSEFAAWFIFQDPLFCVLSDVRKFTLLEELFDRGFYPSGQEEPTTRRCNALHPSTHFLSCKATGVRRSCQVGRFIVGPHRDSCPFKLALAPTGSSMSLDCKNKPLSLDRSHMIWGRSRKHSERNWAASPVSNWTQDLLALRLQGNHSVYYGVGQYSPLKSTSGFGKWEWAVQIYTRYIMNSNLRRQSMAYRTNWFVMDYKRNFFTKL